VYAFVYRICRFLPFYAAKCEIWDPVGRNRTPPKLVAPKAEAYVAAGLVIFGQGERVRPDCEPWSNVLARTPLPRYRLAVCFALPYPFAKSSAI
jgi:hypothetical protein